MITQLRLKSGSSPSAEGLSIETPPSITIFVGANNSGKSQLLREIYAYCQTGQTAANLILDRLDFAAVDEATARDEYEQLKSPPKLGEPTAQGHSYIAHRTGTRFQVSDRNFFLARTDPNIHPDWNAKWFVSGFMLNLDGPARTTLANPASRGNLLEPTNPLARLYMDNGKRSALRKVLFDALGLHIGIDAYTTDSLQLCFGSTAPPNERHHDEQTTSWIRESRKLAQVSDGVKAFTGILLQVYAGDPKIIIVDEPEAFLHPSLAHKLGHELAKGAATERKHIFAATHSSNFVMGAILSGAHVNIVRLTYADGASTARQLPNAEIVALMNDPLLRSIGVLSGLFYDYVVVGEADADRAFYEEINHRLLTSGDIRGIPHALFLNADGKATVPRIVAPLRRLGIPAVGIVDIDVVKDGGPEWTRHLEACSWPTTQIEPSHRHRINVYDSLKAAAPQDQRPEEYFKRHGGVNLLGKVDRETADNLFDDLERYGYFVVRGGEVENWLPSLAVPREKGSKGWRSAIFAAMGSNPSDATYLKPTQGDVWDFTGRIRAWMVDPTRRGIPD